MASNTHQIDWRFVLGDVFGSVNGIASDELEDLNAAIGVHSSRAVRMHPSIDASQLPFESRAIPWFERGRWLADNSCRPGAFLNYAAGDYYIQDAGSMLALALCDVKPGQWVCDTCAAPGGKSSGLLEQLGSTGLVVSNEVIRSRLELLELTLARTGYANYMVTNNEVDELADRFDDAFDCVIVDAPCTGQSMVARGKQSLAAFSPKQIEHSAARQQRILRAAQQLVKPGGRLVYSTCTFAFAENEGMITWFRDTFPEWQPLSSPALTTWESPAHAGCYRLWPHRDHCAGAFAAVLVRPEDSLTRSDLASASPSTSNTRSRNSRFTATELQPAELPWLKSRDPGPIKLWQRGSELHYFNSDFAKHWIDGAHSGVSVAEFRGGEWQPGYGASIAAIPGLEPAQFFELDARQAADYFTGAAIRPAEQQTTGTTASASTWQTLTWKSRRLAWAKLAAGVLKNHLPKALRKPPLIVPEPLG